MKCDFFKDKIGLEDYDDILSGKEDRYHKDVMGFIVKMDPREYIDRCAQLQGTGYDEQFRYLSKKKIEKFMDDMSHGDKFNLPYIDYSTGQQEGRHRSVSVKKLGCNEMSVAIFLKSGQKDPYKVGNDLDNERTYDLTKQSDVRSFLSLYSDFEWKYELYFSWVYGNRLEEDGDIKIEEFMMDIEPVEFNDYLRSEISKYDLTGIMDDGDIGGYGLYELMGLLNSIPDLKDISSYCKRMINSCFSYMFFDDNDDYFVDVDTKYGKIKYDLKSKKIDVFVRGDKIKEDKPSVREKYNRYIVKIGILGEYMRRYPLF